METNENLTEKLEYIGLDLNNIPDKLNFFQNINFRVRKNYIEENYKVYKYVNVNDIEIFLTPTHRLTDYTEKPDGVYLLSNNNIVQYAENYTVAGHFDNLAKSLISKILKAFSAFSLCSEDILSFKYSFVERIS